MLTIWRSADEARRLPRRALLRAAVAAPAAMAALHPRRGAAASATFGRAKRCILVFLNGGPSQLDTWDMKPNSPAEIRGELKPISTSVPGVQVSELLPRMAALADRYKIVRSVTHTASVHTTGVYTMLTGTIHRTPKVDQTRVAPDDHPHLGAVHALWRGWQAGSPPFACLPTLFRAPPVEGIWPGQSAGFLGPRYDPVVVEGDKETARFTAPHVELPDSITAGRLAERRELVSRFDALCRWRDRATTRAALDRAVVWDQAWSLLDSQALSRAVNLESEPPDTRDRYGQHLFGQGLLLARRLSEAGVSLVTVYWIDPTPPGPGGGEFDSHGQIYRHMRERLLPPTDQALSALVSDLQERGLRDDTLLVVMSEFGRTPRINADAGRDHWPEAQSILLAGAGISGGTIHGATDRHAAFLTADPVTPPDLGQTILHMLGVPAELELHDVQGQAVRASQGVVIEELLA